MNTKTSAPFHPVESEPEAEPEGQESYIVTEGKKRGATRDVRPEAAFDRYYTVLRVHPGDAILTDNWHTNQVLDHARANFEGVTRTGVLSVGRANGILRPLHDKGAYVLVAGRPSRVISVTLEYTVVDLSGHPDASSGDTATILGDDGEAVLTIDDATRAAGCSPLDFSIGLRDMALIYRGGE